MTRNMFLKSILCISIVVLTAVGCSASRDIKYISAELQVIEVDSMPDIKILSEIRVLNDQVYLTYESKGGYGQRHIKQYVYDSKSQCLSYDKELFKKDDGFYQLFAPSLFEDDKDPFDKDLLWDRDHIFGRNDWWSDTNPSVYVVHGHTPVGSSIFKQRDILIPEDTKFNSTRTVCRYTHGHKICIDAGCFSTHQIALLDLDTLEERVIK